MNNTPEPLAAILAEMREAAKSTDLFNGEEVGEPLIRGSKVADYADRIEAAAEREREEVRKARDEARETAEDAPWELAELRERAPGNVAAIREALLGLAKFTCSCCNERHCEDDIEEEDGVRVPNPCGAIIAARNALSAPARNCDRFKTLDEAREAFQDLRGHKILADVELWDSMDEAGALVRWLFAPAEGKEPDNG